MFQARCPHQSGVLAGQPDGAPAGCADGRRQCLVDAAGQHHFDDLDRIGARHAKAVNEIAADAEPLQHPADLRAAAMHHDRMDADLLHQHHVAREGDERIGVAHRMAAIFHHDRRAGIAGDMGHGFGQHGRFRDALGELAGGRVGSGLGHGLGSSARAASSARSLGMPSPVRALVAMTAGWAAARRAMPAAASATIRSRAGGASLSVLVSTT